MSRTITVCGTGSVSLKPDLAEIFMTLKSLDENYESSMKKSDDMLDLTRDALLSAGIGEDALRTTDFNVCSEYESASDEHGNYKSVFVGFACIHSVKIEIPADTHLLSAALKAISECTADPNLSVRFTVKDKKEATAELMKSASEDAMAKATALAEASGVKLGVLLSVSDSFSGSDYYSPSNLMFETDCAARGKAMASISPDNVRLEGKVRFVWEII